MAEEEATPQAAEAAAEAKDEDFVLPPNIKFKSVVFDAAFHPTEDIIAVGLVTGYLKMFAPQHTRRTFFFSLARLTSPPRPQIQAWRAQPGSA